jgi:hypothetical protein
MFWPKQAVRESFRSDGLQEVETTKCGIGTMSCLLARLNANVRGREGTGREASAINTESAPHFSSAKTRDVERPAIEILDHPLSF